MPSPLTKFQCHPICKNKVTTINEGILIYRENETVNNPKIVRYEKSPIFYLTTCRLYLAYKSEIRKKENLSGIF